MNEEEIKERYMEKGKIKMAIKPVISLAMPRKIKYENVAAQLKGDSRKRWEEKLGDGK